MAKILLIISALVIAATAYLGFATKGKVEAIMVDLDSKKKVAAAAQTEAGNAKKAMTKAQDELVAAKATIDEKDKDIASKKGEIDKVAADLKKASDDLLAKTEEINKLKEAIGKPGETVDPEKMRAEMDALAKAKTELEVRVAELGQVNETMTKQLANERSKASSFETQVKSYKSDYTKPGITGTVLAYNPGWNFVVISLGDRQSLKAGKEMVVTRDGQMIAKLRVKTVEPTTSIADVIPSSVAKGQSVQPGDSVVYEGRGNK